jgi:hypothetical protein
MDQAKHEKKKQLIEKISRLKNVPLEQAKHLLASLETYCELIINYTLKKKNEQDKGL